MHRGFFLPVKAFPPAPNGPGTGGGRCHATYLCGERFNSRPPRGERPVTYWLYLKSQVFQSTPSARRATPGCCRCGAAHTISIHALREESDQTCSARSSAGYHFNPRPPRGGRRDSPLLVHAWSEFQSTPSVGRATAVCIGNGIAEVISIHALRGESDPWLLPLRSSTHNFNPRPPRGGRRKH